MGKFLSALGTGMVVLSVAGFAWVFFGPSSEDVIHGEARPVMLALPPRAQSARSAPQINAPQRPSLKPRPSAVNPSPTATLAPFVPTPQVATPITRVKIPSIGLDSEVVEAAFVEHGGAPTWDIPKFKAGHAQGTAGAGDDGNAVLLGHVSSIRSGDVFKDLEKVGVGDEVVLFDGDQ